MLDMNLIQPVFIVGLVPQHLKTRLLIPTPTLTYCPVFKNISDCNLPSMLPLQTEFPGWGTGPAGSQDAPVPPREGAFLPGASTELPRLGQAFPCADESATLEETQGLRESTQITPTPFSSPPWTATQSQEEVSSAARWPLTKPRGLTRSSSERSARAALSSPSREAPSRSLALRSQTYSRRVRA